MLVKREINSKYEAYICAHVQGQLNKIYCFAKVLVGNWFCVSVVWTYSARPMLLFCKSNRLQLQQWTHPLLCEEYVCKFTLLISFQF